MDTTLGFSLPRFVNLHHVFARAGYPGVYCVFQIYLFHTLSLRGQEHLCEQSVFPKISMFSFRVLFVDLTRDQYLQSVGGFFLNVFTLWLVL